MLQRFLRIGPPITSWYVQQQLDKKTAKWLPKVRQRSETAVRVGV